MMSTSRVVRLARSLCLLAGLLFTIGVQAQDDFAGAVQMLNEGGFGDKEQAVDTLAGLQHPRVYAVLHAMLERELYVREDGSLFIVTTDASGNTRIETAATGEAVQDADVNAMDAVRTNNSLRSHIRRTLALLSLSNADVALRLAATQELLGDLDAAGAERLRSLLDAETDADVRDAMQAALAVVDLQSEDVDTVIAAAGLLRGNVDPKVRAALGNVAEQHADTRARAEAAAALKSIQHKLDFYAFLETLFFGLSLGSILALAAIGLAITFGVMGVINMAHGELMMLGAYTTFWIQQLFPNQIELSLLFAVPAAFVVSGVAGVAIERGIIRFLYGRPLETLLATFGVSLILQQAVRTFVSAQNVAVITPQWLSGSWQINSVLSFTYNRLYIFLFAMAVFAALVLLLKRTSLGLQVRAVSQNRKMAKAVGIRTEWVDALTFGLGSGIAGIAGVALSQLTNVGPNLGQNYIIDSFMVVVFGGVGNLWGTLVSGIGLGVANKFLEPVVGAVLAKILVLVFIILFIQKRPRGLFPQKGRAADN